MGAFLYIFYTSRLRERIEEHLYDVRVKIAPRRSFNDTIIVANISDKTISATDGEVAGDLSYSSLLRFLQEILDAQPKIRCGFSFSKCFSL